MFIPEDNALLADLKITPASGQALREFVRAYNVHLRAVLDSLKDQPPEERRALVAHLAQFMMGASIGALVHVGWSPAQLARFVEDQARFVAEQTESSPLPVPASPSEPAKEDSIPPTDPAPVTSDVRPSLPKDGA